MMNSVIKEKNMNKIVELLLHKKILISDGAWGTQLFSKGLRTGFAPESWNLDHPEKVAEIAESYLNAGAELISTNTFGANKFKLDQYGLKDKLEEICYNGAKISKRVIDKNQIVIGSIGPTGKFLAMGELTPADLYDTFKLQAAALEKGGADAACIETFYDLDEAEQAIKAVKENTDLEVIAAFSFDKTDYGYRTLMGISPKQMAEKLIICGADIIGANCGRGFADMIEIVKEIRNVSQKIPVFVQPNAGLPEIINGELVYKETPEFIRSIISELIKAGANIIGGCCGTTPEHIKVIADVVKNYRDKFTDNQN